MSGFTLTIPISRQCPLDGLVLYEPIDANLLDKCINSDLLKETYKATKRDFYPNEKIHLEKYAANVSRNLARVEYTRKDGFGIGRVNPVGLLGLHSLSRRTRHTLVKNTMTDVDIENAHNVILLQILHNNNYPKSYANLQHYCDHREEWRTEIQTAFHLNDNEQVKSTDPQKKATPKEIAKDLILRILYGGGITKWKEAWNITQGSLPSKVIELEKEIASIHSYICDNNPALFDLCKQNNLAKGKDYNHQGTACSWFLQDKECQILECVYQYCVENGYIRDDICALCNDGIMLESKHYEAKLLDELQHTVKEQLGFHLRFVEKQLGEDYLDILNNHLQFDLWKCPITDGLYADYFKLLYHNKFVVRHGFSYYYNGVYWEKDEVKRNNRISTHVDSQFKKYIIQRAFRVKKSLRDDLTTYEENKFLNDKGDKATLEEALTKLKSKYPIQTPSPPPHFKGDAVLHFLQSAIKHVEQYIKSVDHYLRSVSSRDRLVKDICRVLTSDWITFDEDEFLLAFLNKIFDLQRGDWVEPHYSQYISLTTGWKWVGGYSAKYVRELTQLIEQIHPNRDVREHYLTVLATGLYGKVIQHFFVAKGVGGNGKSVLNSLMMKSVGKYGYKLPSTAVSQVIKEGANPAIANLNNKRFVLVQEPDRKHKINTSTIKEITGDKELNCRTLYSTDTYTRLVPTLVMECNDLPQLDESGDAIGRRIDVTPFDSKFLTETKWENRTEEEKQSGNIFRADPFYTSDRFQDTYKQALMQMLMERFFKFQNAKYILKPPKAVVREADEYLKYSDDFYGWWSDKFVKDESSIVPFGAVWDVFKDSDYFNNLTKNEKRRYNQKRLKEVILGNMFLKEHLKKRSRIYNGTLLTGDSICGYRIQGWESTLEDVDEF